jgi:GTP cyclohydrolase II
MPLLPTVAMHPTAARAVYVLSRAKLPTQRGQFEIVAFRRGYGDQMRDVAVVRGDVDGAGDVPVRIHSECLTGDVFSSVRCDCGEQLELAMHRIDDAGLGIILYMRQEGRGIGIANKVRAYELQDKGMDTVEANEHLGFDDDLRSYETAAYMLKALGVHSIVLHTNNPKKVDGLRKAGVAVSQREPIAVEPREENKFYLATKRSRSGHLLDTIE